MTLREALSSAIHQLRTREDIAEWAARDANLLLQHVTHSTRTQLLAHPERTLTAEQQVTFNTLIKKRLRATPIQHLTGKQEFYGRDFLVTPDVLIPRPETELIMDEVKALAPAKQQLKITDVGTGSGILAITLALELPHAHITALDISPAALFVAKQNAQHHNAAARITFLESDLLASVHEPQDIILSNPPYIGESERNGLHPQVREHEPSLALFAGASGDDIYHRLIPQAHAMLKPGGVLLLELGTQGHRLNPLFADWARIRYAHDLQGIARVLIARRR
ncbi:MAG: peptide chain release factor N(5)-glutamine methyltransferase [Acidobacteria bacterium]|nr:peptide chain release factor N(5)-glutamine methyltransferase [Acidobacteriota bacterium]